MLPAPHRLKGDQNFKRLMQRGRRFFMPSIMLRVAPTKESESRFAFVVSTKVSKKAVVRNKLRRRLREIVRLELPHIQQGHDVLIAVRPQAIRMSYQELRTALIELFTKARLFHA